MKPFALQIYERYLKGETVERLSAEWQIPIERILQRIRAAAAYTARRRKLAA